jgi:hypothetical protein
MSSLVTQTILFFTTFLSCDILNKTVFKKYSLNITYCALHFLVNCIVTCMCIPYFLTLFKDPNGIESDYEEYGFIRYTYPIIGSLHTFHLYKSFSFIKWDEMLHHIVTYVFWIICEYLSHPFYYISLICLSGIPGGITYLMLFLKSHNILTSLQEKYYSMLINFWMRGPGCIIYSTLLYDRMIYIDDGKFCPIHLFLIGFTMINGIHFTTTIVDSYYRLLLKSS